MPKRSADGRTKDERYRGFCFTQWTDPRAWLAHWRDCNIPEGILFIGGQLELAPNPAPGHDGEHVQGVVEFRSKKTFVQAQELLGGHIALQWRRGTFYEAYTAYCKKAETRVEGVERLERGTPPDPSAKQKLHEFADICKKYKGSFKDLVDEYSVEYLRYGQRMEDLYEKFHPAPNRKRPEIYWFYGPPSSGKSRLARLMFPDHFPAEDCKGWCFNAYEEESDVVFLEFRGEMEYGLLLKLLDYGRLVLNVKQKYRKCRVKRWIFCSVEHPSTYYPTNNVELMSRLERHHATVFDGPTCTARLLEFLDKNPDELDEGDEHHPLTRDLWLKHRVPESASQAPTVVLEE